MMEFSFGQNCSLKCNAKNPFVPHEHTSFKYVAIM